MESIPPEQQARTESLSRTAQGPVSVFAKESSMVMFNNTSEHRGQGIDTGDLFVPGSSLRFSRKAL
jgi:hypothetical protein